MPKNADRGTWTADTRGIRNTLRNEIVEVYRETRISLDEVRWLIRYLASDVSKRWEKGTLLAYRTEYRIKQSTKALASLALAALIPAAVGIIVAAIQTDSLLGTLATLLAAISGRVTMTQWLHISSERRRAIDDRREYERCMEDREIAYQRWKDKLDSRRPSEAHMEMWLNSDKTIILDNALRNYRLAWRDVIAHTFLQTPAKSYKRARVSEGPWRYSKYDIRLFLITQDGVREVHTELDFEKVSLNGQERNNFRFDAVSSVHVTETGQFSHTLALTLTNGPTRNIQIVAPEVQQPDSYENAITFSKIDLDAAGFTHTLHILEGIAAEGKNWINRSPHTNGNSEGPPLATGYV